MTLIYLIRNVENGRWYVGKTQRTLARRWVEHVHRAKHTSWNYPFLNAIRKYGPQAFTMTALLEVQDADANTAEIVAITILKHLEPEPTYNATLGGDGGDTGCRGKARPAHVIAALRHANIGKAKSLSARKKLSAARQLQVMPSWTPERRSKFNESILIRRICR